MALLLSQLSGAGAQTVIPSAIASAEVIGSHTVIQDFTIACTAIDSAEVVGSHTVLPGGVTIDCFGIGTAEAIGDLVVTAGLSKQRTTQLALSATPTQPYGDFSSKPLFTGLGGTIDQSYRRGRGRR